MADTPMDAFESSAEIAERGTRPGYRGGIPAGSGRPSFPVRTRRPRPQDGASRVATPGGQVADAIEAALLPRLVLLHGGRRPAVATGVDADLAALVAPFAASLVVDDDGVAATALLRDLRGRGASYETICLDVMAPAARALGVMWEADDCDFARVTLGLSRLHRLMRDLDSRMATIAVPVDPDRVALLAVVAGEQHVFGLAMVGDFLRRAGWEIHDMIGAQGTEIAQAVRRNRIAVAALSCSSAAGLPLLAGRIAVIRAASRNRAVGILVGGLAFGDGPDQAIRVGADAAARDARDAVFQAERLLAASRAEMAMR